jgi:hypothetical protein
MIPMPRDFPFWFARDLSLDSLAQGFLIFNLQGYEYKVDDLKGAKRFASDITGFNSVVSRDLGFFICNKRIAIASIPLQLSCSGILDSRIAKDFGFDSLAKGFSISICKGVWLGFPCQRIFYFQFAIVFLIFNLKGNGYKVDDLKGAKGPASDTTGFNLVVSRDLGFLIWNKRIAIASFPLQFPCQGIIDSWIAKDFGFDSLAEGIFYFDLQGNCHGITLPRDSWFSFSKVMRTK